MAKESLTDAEFARMKQQKALQQEVKDIGVYGGVGIPGPTKKDLAEARGKKYEEDEVQTICDLIITHKGDIDDVLDAILAKRKTDKEFAVRLIDRPRLYTFVNNHIEDIYKSLRTARALPALMRLAEEADQSSVMLGAVKEINARADGMPTQRIDMSVEHHTWEDIEKEKAKTLEQLKESGTWYTPDELPSDDG